MTIYQRIKPIDILLVEDNPAHIRLTREGFKDADIRNTLNVVTDGEEALSYLKKLDKYSGSKTPDLILLDLNLPKIDGRQVLVEIKSDDALKLIPVIILSTSDSPEDIFNTYANYANCYIMKPIDFDQFVTVARTVEEFWLKIIKLPKI